MKVLTFGAHPDDIETLMGGTIAKYSKKKHDVLMVVATLTDQENRRKESENAAKILGSEILLLDLDPYKLTFNRQLVQMFDKIIKDFSPDVVYTHWIHDSHQDHIVVSNTVIASTRKNNCSLYMYEQAIPGGITPYGFKPQAFVDISDTIDKKIEAVSKHKSQIKNFGQQWIFGIEARAKYWGFQIGTKYAETFEIIRYIKKIPNK